MTEYKVRYNVKTNKFIVLGINDSPITSEQLTKNNESDILILTDIELAKINKKNLIISDNVTIS